MNVKNNSCVCKCKNICECTPDDRKVCEEEIKVLETRRLSISVDVTSLENQPSKNESSQETQYEAPYSEPESNLFLLQEAGAVETGENVKRPCKSPNPSKNCNEKQKSMEKDVNKLQELKSPRTSSIKLFSKESNSVNSLSAVRSDYSRDEWDHFGLFIAAECKSMSKENAKTFKKKCLELILEYQ